MPHRSVWDFVETREGIYWIATLGGLVRFNPLGTPNARREIIRYSDKVCLPRQG